MASQMEKVIVFNYGLVKGCEKKSSCSLRQRETAFGESSSVITVKIHLGAALLKFYSRQSRGARYSGRV